MKKVRIIVDSTTDIITENKDIRILPITIRFGEQEFFHGVNLSNKKFYEKLSTSSVPAFWSNTP